MVNPVKFVVFTISLLIAFSAHAGLPLVDSQGQSLPSLAPLLKKVNPAVVNISVTQTRNAQNPLLNDPFFRHFFNVPRNYHPQQRKTRSAGSGVIINAKKGIVITNHHVVDAADDIQVVLHDGRSFDAKLIGNDPEVDIAILEIKAKDLSELSFADSDETEVGDFVVAIGNPFGLGQTVTTGIVSAIGRSGLGIEGYENFIQTDASINPGNSGGALVNLKGELVGINTAIIAPSGGNVGIGFAIPTNMAKSSLDQILEHGEVKRGQLGVFIQDLSPELAEAFNIDKHQQGVLIAKVQEDSAAEDAGMEEGDIVTAIDGKPVSTAAQLRNKIGMRRIGDKVNVTLLRGGKEKTLKVKIGKASITSNSKIPFKKLEGANLQDTPNAEGVLVAGIQQGSPAAYSGLRPGDIIMEANRQAVSNLADLRKAISNSDNKLLLRINRGGAALFLVIQ
jgi:Do/DeqQ family serine protease